ncbi:renalase [Aplysia californica]|uniref:Renalase n=1 Tax=Aplysia californica TaxID=6500 RepID=A0ABM0K356_APLCA|nr:renalase [Aplysia californica]
MLQKMAKVLLVGSGLTGSATAALLRQKLPENTSISVWDKARGAGGRMSTSRCPNDSSITVDLGAQYITLTQEYKAKRKSLYDELQTQGILAPLTGQIEGPNSFDQPGAEHFVTPKGSSSLVKFFLQKANASMKNECLVTEVSFSDGGQVSVTTREDLTESFDVVVITMPVPQILQLRGSIHDCINSNSSVKKNLQNVSYSSRYALGLFFPPQTNLKYPWSAKYISDNPCVRYIALDQVKRGTADPNQGQSLAVHTNVPFGLAHLEEDVNSVKDELLANVRKVLPDLPEPMFVKPQKWRYSQVHKAYEGRPGCVTLSTNPLVIVAGDGFSGSTFDGCLDSAETVVKIIQENLHTSTSSGL